MAALPSASDTADCRFVSAGSRKRPFDSVRLPAHPRAEISKPSKACGLQSVLSGICPKAAIALTPWVIALICACVALITYLFLRAFRYHKRRNGETWGQTGRFPIVGN